MAAARQCWKADQASLDAKRLVFVDETGTSTKMVRTHGRCRRGQRLIGKAPWGHWKTTTFTAGLRCDGLVAPFVLEGPMNGEAFLIYVETVLAPSLSQGDIVVIDNLSAHKVAGRPRRDRSQGRHPSLPAALFARSQSHRDGVRQAQDTAAQGRRANQGLTLGCHRRCPRRLHARRMRQLPRSRRICFVLSGKCSSRGLDCEDPFCALRRTQADGKQHVQLILRRRHDVWRQTHSHPAPFGRA